MSDDSKDKAQPTQSLVFLDPVRSFDGIVFWTSCKDSLSARHKTVVFHMVDGTKKSIETESDVLVLDMEGRTLDTIS